MRDFRSIADFVGHLAIVSLSIEDADKAALERAAVIVETEAKRAIGTYDYGWPRLAESTLKKKSADTPLLETGALRESIRHSSDHQTARVGSDMDIAVYHEFGTTKMPPRSFLAGATIHKEHEVVKVIGRTITAHIAGVALPSDLLGDLSIID